MFCPVDVLLARCTFRIRERRLILWLSDSRFVAKMHWQATGQISRQLFPPRFRFDVATIYDLVSCDNPDIVVLPYQVKQSVIGKISWIQYLSLFKRFSHQRLFDLQQQSWFLAKDRKNLVSGERNHQLRFPFGARVCLIDCRAAAISGWLLAPRDWRHRLQGK